MYRCQITGKLSKYGEPLHKVVVATRQRTYTKWVRNEETNQWEEVFLATGTEIVKELNCSTEGETEWNAMNQEERWLFLKNYFPYLVKLAEQSQDDARVEVVKI